MLFSKGDSAQQTYQIQSTTAKFNAKPPYQTIELKKTADLNLQLSIGTIISALKPNTREVIVDPNLEQIGAASIKFNFPAQGPYFIQTLGSPIPIKVLSARTITQVITFLIY